ncbi:hypothetical protein [Moritella sp. Urea-trap-13]|uniref:hypothetical protein n=1 Tax=Moritella sp. Urea-trap-13 TaxID=2058327 RepID=UPI000C324B23|nr:hypothetical protein [Moritella sp. Urea-trap-13]PKH04760.1 hypothetical protein CXF93_21330 [Moritella sp. Urea-trap-13]
MKVEPLLEFHFNYSKNRKNAGEVFHALGYFIDAYVEFGQIMADAIGDDLDFEIQLTSVTEGSIKVRFLKFFDAITSPDIFICDLKGEIGTLDQLQAVTAKQNKRLSETLKSNNKYSERIEPTINDLNVALTLEKWTLANKQLQQDESITIGDVDALPGNVISIDTSFRFTGSPKEMFKNFVGKHDGEEYVDVIRSYHRGDQYMWRFQNRKTRLEYNAPIKHKKWLQEFHEGIHQVNPVDCLLIHSSYEVWRINGKDTVTNAKVLEVIDVIKGSDYQHEIIERD